jgi:hypothetical protein
VAGERWDPGRRNLALRAANAVLLGVLSAARGAGLRVEARGSSDHRLRVLVVDLPGSRSLAVGVYASTEESRPLSPARAVPRVERLRRLLAAVAPPGSDTLLFIVAASPRVRATTATRRLLARRYAAGFHSPESARRWIHRYLAKRLRGLLQSLRRRGVKAYGRLAELLRSLYLLARELGHLDVTLADVESIIRA